MPVVEDTMIHYPKMAKIGWCFASNVVKDTDLDFDKMGLLVEMFKHFGASEVIVMEDLPAYDYKDRVIKGCYPAFVKVTKQDILRRLRSPVTRSLIENRFLDIKIFDRYSDDEWDEDTY